MPVKHAFAEPQENTDETPHPPPDETTAAHAPLPSEESVEAQSQLLTVVREEPKHPFRWTGKAREALRLLQEGEMTPEEVCAAVGIQMQTLQRWTSQPAFGYDSRVFAWTPQKEMAAAYLAQGKETREVAAAININHRTIARWKARPEFRERLANNMAEIREAIMSAGIASKMERMKRYNERWLQLEQVRRERAEAYANDPNVPGGATGIVKRELRPFTEMTDDGPRTRLVPEYTIDTAAMKEERELAKQAAMEAGDWAEKTENTHMVVVRSYGSEEFPVDLDKV